LTVAVPREHLRELPSFPTRRSSDLRAPIRLINLLDQAAGVERAIRRLLEGPDLTKEAAAERLPCLGGRVPHRRAAGRDGRSVRRSEEHTSELQSRENLVCRLLLEKK